MAGKPWEHDWSAEASKKPWERDWSKPDPDKPDDPAAAAKAVTPEDPDSAANLAQRTLVGPWNEAKGKGALGGLAAGAKVAAKYVGGLGENAMQIGSGLAGQVGSGIADLGVAGHNLFTDNRDDWDANKVNEAIQGTVTYKPMTDAGKLIAKAPAALGNAIEGGSQWLGDKAEEHGASPLVSAGVKTLPTAAMMLLDPAVRGTVLRGSAAPLARAIPKERPITAGMTPEEEALATQETLLANDIPLARDQRGKGALARNAKLGGDTIFGPSKLEEEQGLAYTRAVNDKVGNTGADRASTDTMAAMKTRVKGSYEDLASRGHGIDDELVTDIDKIRKDIEGSVSEADRAPLLKNLEEITKRSAPGQAKIQALNDAAVDAAKETLDQETQQHKYDTADAKGAANLADRARAKAESLRAKAEKLQAAADRTRATDADPGSARVQALQDAKDAAGLADSASKKADQLSQAHTKLRERLAKMQEDGKIVSPELTKALDNAAKDAAAATEQAKLAQDKAGRTAKVHEEPAAPGKRELSADEQGALDAAHDAANDAADKADLAAQAHRQASHKADQTHKRVRMAERGHADAKLRATPDNTIATGQMDGQAALNIRTNLGHLQKSQAAGVGHAATAIKKALDNAYTRTASPEDAAAMKETNLQHGFRKDITRVVKSTPDSTGLLSPRKMAGALAQGNEEAWVNGTGDQRLTTLTKAAAKGLSPKVGNSGTAARASPIHLASKLLTNPIGLLKEVGTIAAGKFWNERNAARGTRSEVIHGNAQKVAGGDQPVRRAALAAALGANGNNKSKKGEALAAAMTQPVNAAYAKPAPSGGYLTKLSPHEEQAFSEWVKANKVPFDPSPTADYDMRGFWKGLTTGDPRAHSDINKNDHKLHYSDYWKTPYHVAFSNESQWANSTAPKWNDKDQLVTADGTVVYDERAKNGKDRK